MNQIERELRIKLQNDFTFYAKRILKVRTKSGGVTNFILNQSQRYIHDKLQEQRTRTGKVRAIILKGRQMGCSTLVAGRFYHRVTHSFGCQAFILAHEAQATNNLYEIANRYYEHTPDLIRPVISKSNAKELRFGELDSGYKLGTALNKNVGRSATIQLLHCSEVGFWENAAEHATGVMQAVPDMANTEIILESTANGVGGYFHEMWQQAEAGLSEYLAIFVPWFWQDEYVKDVGDDFKRTEEEAELNRIYGLTDNQLVWRRNKIVELSANGRNGILAFQQEYPCIVGSQRVGTNAGILPIKDLLPNYSCADGIIKRQWCNGRKETIAIETELGYRLECTKDHRIYLKDATFLEAINCLGQNIKLSIPLTSVNMAQVYWNPMPCIHSKIDIGEDFALFLGFFMGDGSFGGDALSFAFDKRDPVSIQIVRELIIKLFDREPHQRATSENGVELRLGIKDVKDLFFQLGIIEQRPYGVKRLVCVPDCIWKSPKHIIKQFLRGLFDADGFAGYNNPRVSFFSKHVKFAQDVQLLLLIFGITCKRTHAEKIAGNGSVYMGNQLALRANEARLFGASIGFVSDRKNARILEWLKPGAIGRTAKEIIWYDKVKSIEPLGMQLVYDLEMEYEPHIFEAQGIQVHNCSAAEAFVLSGEDNFISSHLVLTARKTIIPDRYGAVILGVDPARFGQDRTCIIRRQGRIAYKLETYSKIDTMQIVGKIITILNNETIDMVCIDVGGLGAGIVDRLRELVDPKKIYAVNFGGSPFEELKYRNKRAEMWANMKEWFIEGGCQVVDSDELQSDIINVKYTIDSNSRLLLESKEAMKKRGVRSSDAADALAVTFALPKTYFAANLRVNTGLETIATNSAMRRQLSEKANYRKP